MSAFQKYDLRPSLYIDEKHCVWMSRVEGHQTAGDPLQCGSLYFVLFGPRNDILPRTQDGGYSCQRIVAAVNATYFLLFFNGVILILSVRNTLLFHTSRWEKVLA